MKVRIKNIAFYSLDTKVGDIVEARVKTHIAYECLCSYSGKESWLFFTHDEVEIIEEEQFRTIKTRIEIRPKEKAKDLVYAFQYLVTIWDCYNDEPLKLKYTLPYMKKCALIVVDELIKQCWDYRAIDLQASYDYWQEVKQEIQAL